MQWVKGIEDAFHKRNASAQFAAVANQKGIDFYEL